MDDSLKAVVLVLCEWAWGKKYLAIALKVGCPLMVDVARVEYRRALRVKKQLDKDNEGITPTQHERPLTEQKQMKKYTSREQIIKDIDSAHKKIAKAKKVAQEHLDLEEFLTGGSELQELRKHREAADFQLRKIKRLENRRLPLLGRKLAEWDTIPLVASLDTELEKLPPPCEPPQPQPFSASDDVLP